jgi:hypothetical protein
MILAQLDLGWVGAGVARVPVVGQATGMENKGSDQHSENQPEAPGDENLTAFGEPLWLDALKTMGVFLAMLCGVIAIGAVLGVMIIAPWGRESFDCSIYCVLERELSSFFSGKPS